ncbi:hypothetical protein [Tenacibaculum caenipelagi]|uniref:Uncharacterized protein n=1 Tax=Tenacibaculum caenipelagi TaxID=1325435 RepID=A0A4R6TFM2_9FLAO|nr:hypothetical protein [Tenacibaculum caenipelagi]TDQ25428.1 hypothetical protein DFQ07_1849 [Tenacibaculum caenipelagi]
MKLFNFIIYYCIATCIITLLSTFISNDYNYISIGLSLFGIAVSIISKYTKENLILLVLIWYLSATLINEAVNFNLLTFYSSSISISFGKMVLSFNLFYLVPFILILIHYNQLSLLNKKLKGTVHTESSQIPFGIAIEFELNDFKDKKLKGITDMKIEGEIFDKISFEKIQDTNKSLAVIEISNERKKLGATIKLN